MMKLKLNLIFPLVFIFSFLHAQLLEDRTILHDNELRDYTIYVPLSYQEYAEVPLMFNFHGGAADIASQISISDMRSLADEEGFILVYPQALADPNDGGSTIWTHKPPTDHDDVFFVEALIDQLKTEYAVDEDRVYACGYSNGGEFALELACRLSDRFAAVATVARSIYIETYQNCSPGNPIPILSIHGTKDDYEGIIWAGVTYYISLDEMHAHFVDLNNANDHPEVNMIPDTDSSDGSTVEHYIWADGDGCVSIEHFKVINGGHDWPGSFGNMDIDATKEIWKFVSEYNIDGLINCNTTNSIDVQNKKLQVFPSPTQDVLNIKIDQNELMEYQIYSTSMNLIMTGSLDQNERTIKVSELPSSVYFLRIGNRMEKFIKLK